MNITRRTARENAFIAAFEVEFRPDELSEIIAYSRECGEYAVDAYGEALLCNMTAHLPEIDAMIEARLKDWTLARLPKVNLTVLRMAVAEMRFGNEGQDMDSVVINEAVELAKAFGDEKTAKFVNGVLAKMKPLEANEKN